MTKSGDETLTQETALESFVLAAENYEITGTATGGRTPIPRLRI